eukprot:MONOS_14469.1-p1 / transcript=MONOS_14469.1 / gene=MONOS_14469 / organism=Monocercomonoides_exilis_PA203 / gene_product=Basic immunoglobulin-like variable motif-containing protein / transcript_product=Basic immunoglobulin-like variable motif-containing protein / location=Mono_scaffold01007:10471-16068(-) / protein_length=1331 / sequence_SO=supercontig / SO=protein_coding / is_pseudo=false
MITGAVITTATMLGVPAGAKLVSKLRSFWGKKKDTEEVEKESSETENPTDDEIEEGDEKEQLSEQDENEKSSEEADDETSSHVSEKDNKNDSSPLSASETEEKEDIDKEKEDEIDKDLDDQQSEKEEVHTEPIVDSENFSPNSKEEQNMETSPKMKTSDSPTKEKKEEIKGFVLDLPSTEFSQPKFHKKYKTVAEAMEANRTLGKSNSKKKKKKGAAKKEIQEPDEKENLPNELKNENDNKKKKKKKKKKKNSNKTSESEIQPADENIKQNSSDNFQSSTAKQLEYLERQRREEELLFNDHVKPSLLPNSRSLSPSQSYSQPSFPSSSSSSSSSFSSSFSSSSPPHLKRFDSNSSLSALSSSSPSFLVPSAPNTPPQNLNGMLSESASVHSNRLSYGQMQSPSVQLSRFSPSRRHQLPSDSFAYQQKQPQLNVFSSSLSPSLSSSPSSSSSSLYPSSLYPSSSLSPSPSSSSSSSSSFHSTSRRNSDWDAQLPLRRNSSIEMNQNQLQSFLSPSPSPSSSSSSLSPSPSSSSSSFISSPSPSSSSSLSSLPPSLSSSVSSAISAALAEHPEFEGREIELVIQGEEGMFREEEEERERRRREEEERERERERRREREREREERNSMYSYKLRGQLSTSRRESKRRRREEKRREREREREKEEEKKREKEREYQLELERLRLKQKELEYEIEKEKQLEREREKIRELERIRGKRVRFEKEEKEEEKEEEEEEEEKEKEEEEEENKKKEEMKEKEEKEEKKEEVSIDSQKIERKEEKEEEKQPKEKEEKEESEEYESYEESEYESDDDEDEDDEDEEERLPSSSSSSRHFLPKQPKTQQVTFSYPFLRPTDGGVKVLDGVFDPNSLVFYAKGKKVPNPAAFNPSVKMPGYPEMAEKEEKEEEEEEEEEREGEEKEEEGEGQKSKTLKKRSTSSLIRQHKTDLVVPSLSPVTFYLPFFDRKFLHLCKWHCVPRPQYKTSCGISCLTGVFNYLFSCLGSGSLPPLTTEQVLAILGFTPPFGEIHFGKFTGNGTLLMWFMKLCMHFGVKGRCVYLWKHSGANKTVGVTPEMALRQLKEGLRSDKTMFIYHCHNHYITPVGYEETPPHATLAYAKGNFTENDIPSIDNTASSVPNNHLTQKENGSASTEKENLSSSSSSSSLSLSSSLSSSSSSSPSQPSPIEPKTTIFLADTSRTSSALLSAKWENIATDIMLLPPQHFNIRKPWIGVYKLGKSNPSPKELQSLRKEKEIKKMNMKMKMMKKGGVDVVEEEEEKEKEEKEEEGNKREEEPNAREADISKGKQKQKKNTSQKNKLSGKENGKKRSIGSLHCILKFSKM